MLSKDDFSSYQLFEQKSELIWESRKMISLRHAISTKNIESKYKKINKNSPPWLKNDMLWKETMTNDMIAKDLMRVMAQNRLGW